MVPMKGHFYLIAMTRKIQNLRIQITGEGGDGPQPDIFVDNALLIFPIPQPAKVQLYFYFDQ